MEKIVFFHMNQLGDLLFSLPVLSSARKQWPQSKIYSVARTSHAGLLQASGFVDEVMPKPRGGVSAGLSLIKRLRKERMDLGIFFSESPESLIAGFAGGVRERVGFSSAVLSFLLTRQVRRGGVPSLRNNGYLGSAAGLAVIPASYAGLVKVPEGDHDKASIWMKERNLKPGNCITLSPGASRRRLEKQWPNENWVKLASTIAANGLTPVFTGALSEKDELEKLAEGLKGRAFVFCPEDGVLQLAALIKASRAFVSIDSGAMHLAAALGAEVTALFGPTDHLQVGPMPLEKNTVIKKEKMSDITPEEVWEKVSGSQS